MWQACMLSSCIASVYCSLHATLVCALCVYYMQSFPCVHARLKQCALQPTSGNGCSSRQHAWPARLCLLQHRQSRCILCRSLFSGLFKRCVTARAQTCHLCDVPLRPGCDACTRAAAPAQQWRRERARATKRAAKSMWTRCALALPMNGAVQCMEPTWL